MQQLVCHLTTVHVRSDVRVFFKECVSLASGGYKVCLIVADGKGNSLEQGVSINDLGGSRNRLQRILFAPIRMFMAALKMKAAVYHFHDPELLPVGVLLKWFTRAKVIYDAHESYPDDMLYKDYLPWLMRKFASKGIDVLERLVTKRMDAVITVTEHHAQRFRKYNLNTWEVSNYPRLSEWKALIDAPTEKLPRSICYVGNITQKRGLTQLIKAMEGLDVTLHLAGSYEPAEYRNELTRLPAWSKVVEYGYVNREEAVQIIAMSQAGIMLFLPEPNHINSLSTKVFEYMAGGTAVLVSHFPVYKALIADTGCGVCVDPLDVKSISEALTQLLENTDDSIAMGQKGRYLVANTYKWDLQEEKLLELYAKLFADNHK